MFKSRSPEGRRLFYLRHRDKIRAKCRTEDFKRRRNKYLRDYRLRFPEKVRAQNRKLNKRWCKSDKGKEYHRKYQRDRYRKYRSEILLKRRIDYHENPEKYRKHNRNYYNRNPTTRYRWRLLNIQKVREANRNWMRRNREKLLPRKREYRRTHYIQHRDEILKRQREMRIKNIDKIRLRKMRDIRREVDELRDSYVRATMAQNKQFPLPRNIFPPELVELKRNYLRLLRASRQKTRKENPIQCTQSKLAD